MNAPQMHLLGFDKPLTDEEIFCAFMPGEFFTRKMLADRLGRAKSPTLVSRLSRLTDEGFYDRQWHKLPNGVDMAVYSLTERGSEAWEKARNEHLHEDGVALGL